MSDILGPNKEELMASLGNFLDRADKAGVPDAQPLQVDYKGGWQPKRAERDTGSTTDFYQNAVAFLMENDGATGRRIVAEKLKIKDVNAPEVAATLKKWVSQLEAQGTRRVTQELKGIQVDTSTQQKSETQQ